MQVMHDTECTETVTGDGSTAAEAAACTAADSIATRGDAGLGESDVSVAAVAKVAAVSPEPLQREIGGRKGPDPTRYGDWEKNGRCIDF